LNKLVIESNEIAKDICGVGPIRVFKTGTKEPYDSNKFTVSEGSYMIARETSIPNGLTQSVDLFVQNDGNVEFTRTVTFT